MAQFSIADRIKSVGFALAGIKDLFSSEHNARVHAVATLLVLALALWLPLARWEWVALVFAIGSVLVAEALNTAVEHVADACMPEQHPLIKRAKDVAAAGVLLMAVTAALVGVIIFIPHVAAVLGF